MVALKRPVVEIVGARQLRDVVVQLVGAREASRLAGYDGVRISATGDFAATAPDADIGHVPIAVDINPVFAGMLQIEGQIGSVYFDDIAVIEMANPQDDRACRQAQLRSAIIEIKQRDAGFRRQSDRGRAYMHFGARALISPKIVARSQRPVGHSGYPVALSARLKTH